MSAVRAIHIAGLLALLSALVWAATGVGWWLPPTDPPGVARMIVLGLGHFFAMFVALMSYI